MPLLRDFPFAFGKRTPVLGLALASSALAALSLSTAPLAYAGNAHSSNNGPLMTPGRVSPQDPLTYLADHESYDKTGLILWKGNVRVWQGGQALRADEITYDRAAGIMRARGHVSLVQPDGSTTYADHVELSHGMKDGIGTAIYMRMEQNAKLAATGMRRSNGVVNDFSNAVYTACKTCAQNPDALPFWQFQAYGATQDRANQNIEFNHAWLKVLGLPVFYFPYFAVTDPTAKRHSGLLTFNVNPHDRYLGTYFTLPYYWVIDDQQDLTFVPLIASHTGPQLSAQYRHRFNFGKLKITAGIADDTRRNTPFYNAFGERSTGGKEHGAQGYIFGNGDFNLDRHWRAGFNVNIASSANYMRDYRLNGYGSDTLPTNAYLEGFGVGSHIMLDAQGYQGLNRGIINNKELPYALPRFSYDFTSQPDILGGRLSVHSTDFYVYRQRGVNDQRGELALQWDRPFQNRLGQKWLLTARLDSMLYHSTRLNEQPIYGKKGSHVSGQVQPTVSLKMNWPFLRTFAKGHGSQIFEPIVQFIASPNTGGAAMRSLPNEDSFTYEFSDTTLFALNRYMGTDRLDGGIRGNVGIHQNWTWNGHSIDMLVGESFQQHITRNRPAFSGLDHHLSDPVGRVTFTPNQYLDITARGRYNPWRKKFDYGEALFSAGIPQFRITGGYIYGPVTPYYYSYVNYNKGSNALQNPYNQETSELSGGVSTRWRQYHFSAYARRSLSRKQFVATGGDVGYSNDCFGLDVIYVRQYTYIGGQRRNSTVLLNFTFKTIGNFGING
ncbi:MULTISPECIES: LPS-assembly protein LptD [unclassified Saccharibacter]|uniref:LPS-assembly protein LptD n=1 Tax=unclassified Saccharibacter TaxID=2648722 RepID=UPI0013280E67|nr:MULTISPECIES: LPS assembly protein LptD [unclassified Saccharibacter]MXV35013.1 LPS assembly protein LptD [Saccharibacter sp. EH611]MXV57440.1 LPS assembly protein LptD [Saccharibacter sp. EH70]MXV64699.1 LPS assembly protein LptD [Saccharibacter sp. EH60]